MDYRARVDSAAIGAKFYNTSHEVGHYDVLHISDLSLATFCDNLRIRYLNDLYYTYIGEVCVSVNPNRPNTGIYGPDYMQLYYGKKVSEMPPHIFAIAGAAYQQTFERNKDSCVVITGESGSGKTEASKLLHLFIAHIVKTKQQIDQTSGAMQNIAKVESILLNSNCILEAFGNAQTLRNLNSSRFGKYTEICFSHNKVATTFKDGVNLSNEQHFYAVIHNYMLEKSRVIKQQTGERNFHAFYQLLAGQEKAMTNLSISNDPSLYKYLYSDNATLTDQDGKDFLKVVDAMQKIGFSEHEQKTIWHLLAAILHLGNINFESIDTENGELGDNYSQHIVPSSMHHLEQFCILLNLDLLHTLETLCSRKIRTPKEVMNKPYSQAEAINGRDALAKALYERLFYFILALINRPLLDSKPSAVEQRRLVTNSIGILDIYGFEVLSNQANLFEQFLVNYCNEKLHQIFVDVILHKEQILYNREDLNWEMVEFDNNLPICMLFDEPHRGMFAILDEACTSGQKNTDKHILSEFNRRFTKNGHFKSRALNPALRKLRPQTDFIIRHYAGDVHYTINGFLEKNMDQLYGDYKHLLYSSENKLIKDMWRDGKQIDPDVVTNKFPLTSSTEFRRSMCELTERLTPKRQFFVRCIKPNEDLTDESGDKFNDAKVRDQIQYLGLVENARVSKAGFVSRIPYHEFVQRFRMLYPGRDADWGALSWPRENAHLKPIYGDICKAIIENNYTQASGYEYALGKTMIFFRAHATIEWLELRRFDYLERLVLQIQTYSRSLLAKRRFSRMKLAQQILKQFARIKKYQYLEGLFFKLAKYNMELASICKNTPSNLLEYYQLDLFEWPSLSLQAQENDQILLRELPPLVGELNKLLIILKFPFEYWRDKLLRMDACKIFWAAKADWGETRRRWHGDYLTDSNECAQSDEFIQLFRHNVSLFKDVIFCSYVLKTNSNNWEQIRALVMTETDIYKVDIDNMRFAHWTSIELIDSVSMSPDADQLVVLHINSRDSDLVFSFYSLTANLSISSSQSALGNCSAKVGEFVTLLCHQYKKLRKCDLPVHFQKEIPFKFAGVVRTIKAQTSAEASKQPFVGHYLLRHLRKLFTLKRIRELYLRVKPLIGTDASENELLQKRVEFEKIASNSFVLVYNVC